MKFHVLAVLSREPNQQQFQNRAVIGKVLEVQDPKQLSDTVANWLGMVLREEPCSTKLLSLSHAQVT